MDSSTSSQVLPLYSKAGPEYTVKILIGANSEIQRAFCPYTVIQEVEFEKHVYGKKRKDDKAQLTSLLKNWVLLTNSSTVQISN